MSEVYCRICEDDYIDGELVPIPKDRLDSPAILTNVTQRRRQTQTNAIIHQKQIYSNLNGGDNTEFKISKTPKTTSHEENSDVNANKNAIEDYELGDDVATNNSESTSEFEQTQKFIRKAIDANDMIRVRGKEELPVLSDETEISYRKKSIESNTSPIKVSNKNICSNVSSSVSQYLTKESEEKCSLSETNISKTMSKSVSKRSVCSKNHPLLSNEEESFKTIKKIESQNECEDTDNDENRVTASENISFLKRMHGIYSTLPKIKKITADQNLPNTVNRPPFSIPMRITSDGTTIYYICDLPKNVIKGVHICCSLCKKSRCFCNKYLFRENKN